MQSVSVLITGASGDIGLELYRQLSKDPRYTFYLHFRNKKSYARVKEYISAERTTLLFADLANLDEVQAMSKEVPTIDALINNAGYYETRPFLDAPFVDIQRMININYLAPLMLSHHVAKGMKQKGGGKIINLSSGSAKHTGLLPSFGYAAGKNGLNFMAKALNKELEPNKIAMTTIVLRFVQTKMLDSYAGYYRKITGNNLDLNSIDKKLKIHSPASVAQHIRELIEDNSLPGGTVTEML